MGGFDIVQSEENVKNTAHNITIHEQETENKIRGFDIVLKEMNSSMSIIGSNDGQYSKF